MLPCFERVDQLAGVRRDQELGLDAKLHGELVAEIDGDAARGAGLVPDHEQRRRRGREGNADVEFSVGDEFFHVTRSLPRSFRGAGEAREPGIQMQIPNV